MLLSVSSNLASQTVLLKAYFVFRLLFEKQRLKKCGPSCGVSGVVRLPECNNEITNLLISCHLSKEDLDEKSSRAGFNIQISSEGLPKSMGMPRAKLCYQKLIMSSDCF